MSSRSERQWRVRADLAIVESESRVVVLDLRRLAEPPRILRDSAVVVWQALQGRTTAGVVSEVAAVCDVREEEVRHHVEQFLEELKELGLADAT